MFENTIIRFFALLAVHGAWLPPGEILVGPAICNYHMHALARAHGVLSSPLPTMDEETCVAQRKASTEALFEQWTAERRVRGDELPDIEGDMSKAMVCDVYVAGPSQQMGATDGYCWNRPGRV